MTLLPFNLSRRNNRVTYIENLPLRSRQRWSEEEDIIPDSDASLLRSHYDSNAEDNAPLNVSASSNLLQRLISSMSRTPLLSGLSSTNGRNSYATLSGDDLTVQEDPSESASDDSGDFEARKRRKGKEAISRKGSIVNRDSSSSPKEGASVSSAWQTPSGSAGVPASDGGKLSKDPTPPLNTVVDVDKDKNKWDDENPPDNSPLV